MVYCGNTVVWLDYAAFLNGIASVGVLGSVVAVVLVQVRAGGAERCQSALRSVEGGARASAAVAWAGHARPPSWERALGCSRSAGTRAQR